MPVKQLETKCGVFTVWKWYDGDNDQNCRRFAYGVNVGEWSIRIFNQGGQSDMTYYYSVHYRDGRYRRDRGVKEGYTDSLAQAKQLSVCAVLDLPITTPWRKALTLLKKRLARIADDAVVAALANIGEHDKRSTNIT